MAIVHYSSKSSKPRLTIIKEWELYDGYRIRPLSSSVNFYRRIILEHTYKRKNFLIYGPAPEIRNIFQELCLNVVIMDKSEAIVRATGELTNAKKPISGNEVFVKLNDFAFNFFHQKIDVIVADPIILIDELQFIQFLKQTTKLLNRGGVLIFRLLINSLGYNTLNLELRNSLKNCSSKNFFPRNKFEKFLQKYYTVGEIFYSHTNKNYKSQPIYVLKRNEKTSRKLAKSRISGSRNNNSCAYVIM